MLKNKHPSNPTKTYGPYAMSSEDGRKIVIMHYADGSKKTTAHARWKVECSLGRVLRDDEQVDHKNDKPWDDRISNLQVLELPAHRKKTRLARGGVTWHVFECPVCGKTAMKREADVKHNRKMGKAGPYCSRQCAGRRHN